MISVGIDVSKGKSMVCALRPYGEVVISPYETEHTDEVLSSLCKRIEDIATDSEVRIVMEATGAYHLPILYKLKERSFFVCVVNPLVMKKYASASIRKGKTDKLDSVRIANFGIDNWFKLSDYMMPEETYEELRILGRQYVHYIEVNVKCKLSLTNLIDRTMPGIKKYFGSKNSDKPEKYKLCDFVDKYWHFDNITKFTEDEFVDEYNNWAKEMGYHQNAIKAKAIYTCAKAGIPTLSSASETTKMLVKEAVRVTTETGKTLSVILSQMQSLSIALPEYETVRQMQGVGTTLAPRLIAEIGDVRRFRSGSALVAYAGLDSPPFESGSFVGTKRSISKRGSPLLRKTGYEVMKCLKTVKPTEDNAVYQFILKKESEGKSKKSAKIAGLNKFLRIYYARVKEIYSPTY